MTTSPVKAVTARLRPIADRLGLGRRGRLSIVILTGVLVVGLTAAVSSASSVPPGVWLTQAGHWFADPDDKVIYHVNGSAGTIDAQVRVDGLESGSQVVEGDTSGFVVGRSSAVTFDKSTLSVEQAPVPLPTDEVPVTVETRGGPYLVFRQAGTVMRLGDQPVTIHVGSELGDPVATPDGVLWLLRTKTNVLCRLQPGTDVVSCPTAAPAGHPGALTVVDGRPVFVDTQDDTLRSVTPAGLGTAVAAGTDISDDAKIATGAVAGRIAVLDPQAGELRMLDASGLAAGRPAAAVEVRLPKGTYSAPVAGKGSVVLLDLGRRAVLTFDQGGRAIGDVPVPAEPGSPRLLKGQDDRVYVAGGKGKNVLIVDDHGRAGAVPPVGSGVQPPSGAPKSPPGQSSSPPPGSIGSQTGPATRGGTTAGGGGGQPRPAGGSTTGSGSGHTSPPSVPSGTTRKAVPPTPPGMPPRVKASASSGKITVTWGAAAANGAPVTGYRIGWAPTGGGGGAVTKSGSARSATLSGLTAGVTYRISVAAQNSAGRGAAATRQVTIPKPAPTRTVTVSRGATTTYEHGCVPPSCAFIKVVLHGFAPHTEHDIEPYTSDWGNFNPGAVLSTDGQGNMVIDDRFPCNAVGQKVWVTVDGKLTSNKITWPSK